MGAGAAMKVAVAGLWHLGAVTAACCARHFSTVGIDGDPENVRNLNLGRAPLFEPGLDDLLQAGLASRNLHFQTEPAACDILWLTYDTPVNEQDESDVEFVLERARPLIPHARAVVVSSQLPVGTCAQLEREFPGVPFACSPENLRLGKAIAAFGHPERIVAGLRSPSMKPVLEELFAPFSNNITWMKTESAEMVKHGLNGFLALSIAYINEVAVLCERTGADAAEVAAGLKSDPRIGPRAYLSPGGSFAGGTLARDLVSLTRLGERTGERLTLIPAIRPSNEWHADWAFRRLQSKLGSFERRTVAVLGLAYTPGTGTLRRSSAVALCRQLAESGAAVRAHDPLVRELPSDLKGFVTLFADPEDAIAGADAVVVSTGCPEFRALDWLRLARGRVVLDANGFLASQLQGAHSEYYRVGQ